MRAMTRSGLVAVLVLAALAGGERLLRADNSCDGSGAVAADPLDPCSPNPDVDPIHYYTGTCATLPGYAKCDESGTNQMRPLATKCDGKTSTLGTQQCVGGPQGVCYTKYVCYRDPNTGECKSPANGTPVNRTQKWNTYCDSVPPGGDPNT